MSKGLAGDIEVLGVVVGVMLFASWLSRRWLYRLITNSPPIRSRVRAVDGQALARGIGMTAPVFVAGGVLLAFVASLALDWRLAAVAGFFAGALMFGAFANAVARAASDPARNDSDTDPPGRK